MNYKVIHLITSLDIGGAEIQLLELCRLQRDKQREIDIVFMKGAGELSAQFQEIGCRVLDTLKNRNLFFQYQQLLRIFRKERAENILIHAHLPRAELFASLTKRRHRLIITRHNSEPFWPLAPNILSRLLSWFCCKRASAILFISKAAKDYALAAKELSNTFEAKSRVIYYAPRRSLASNSISSRNCHSSGNFLCISRLVAQKDISTLLRGFSLYLKENASSHLTIIGHGQLHSQLLREADELRINSHLTWISKTPNIEEFFSACDVFILTSRYEGFGMVLLEAMQMNRAIVASNSDAATEVLGSNFPGLFEIGNQQSLFEKLVQLESKSYYQDNLVKQKPRLDLFSSNRLIGDIESVYFQSLWGR